MIDVIIPNVGESITEVTISSWLVKSGDYVKIDQPIAEIESEKASFEINAEKGGQVKILAEIDATVSIGGTIAQIDETVEPPKESTTQPPKEAISEPPTQPLFNTDQPSPKPATEASPKITPLANAIVSNNQLDISQIQKQAGEKITKQDILNNLSKQPTTEQKKPTERTSETVKMTMLRKTIARRLTEVKNTTAMLTTFNEVDMSNIMKARSQYKKTFQEKHDINLGFMSFFTKAVAIALMNRKQVNAIIEDDKITTYNYCDISIAVSTPKGLVVPIIRNAEQLTMHEIELRVANLAAKARDGKLSMDEMFGGTFTITNGGVFGSLMSTPILNAPQSAILGMHKIQQRPVVVDGQIVIRPMMYLALSYDHRIIDGKDSVGFLVDVKTLLENPSYLLSGKNPLEDLLNI